MARNNHQRIDRIIVCADETNRVAHAGVLAFMQWCEQRGVLRLMVQWRVDASCAHVVAHNRTRPRPHAPTPHPSRRVWG